MDNIWITYEHIITIATHDGLQMTGLSVIISKSRTYPWYVHDPLATFLPQPMANEPVASR